MYLVVVDLVRARFILADRVFRREQQRLNLLQDGHGDLRVTSGRKAGAWQPRRPHMAVARPVRAGTGHSRVKRRGGRHGHLDEPDVLRTRSLRR
ncbi:hypothetical protein QZN11_40275 [Streptomyces gramineus]|uniref:hypothetical protein n=1 Tax=Streptomyces gramineus TaxID=910542 RepID=UPI00398B3CF3